MMAHELLLKIVSEEAMQRVDYQSLTFLLLPNVAAGFQNPGLMDSPHLASKAAPFGHALQQRQQLSAKPHKSRAVAR